MSQQQAALDALTEDAIVLQGRPSQSAQRLMMWVAAGAMLAGNLLGFASIYRKHGHIPWQVVAIMGVFCLVMMAYMKWRLKSMMKKIESRQIPLTLRIDSQGIAVQDILGVHGPVPWAVLGELTPRRFLFPMVHFALTDVAAAKKALGSRYWVLWFPGGLAIRSDLFGLTSEELIARINRYRQHGLG